MRLVHHQPIQRPIELSPPSSIPPPKRAYSCPVSSHRRARLACDLAAAGADGTGAMVKRHRADIDSWSAVGGSRGILGRTRDGVSQTPPTRRRLMGLGDKTATARRPELAGQPTARSVHPSSKRYLQTHTPGEGPALRPALQTSQPSGARPIGRARKDPIHPRGNLAYNPSSWPRFLPTRWRRLSRAFSRAA